jgi:hypothetical protein
MGANETWSSSGCDKWTFILLLYISVLHTIMSDKSNPVLFAGDVSIIVTNSNPLAFRSNINEVFREVNERFQGNIYCH